MILGFDAGSRTLQEAEHLLHTVARVLGLPGDAIGCTHFVPADAAGSATDPAIEVVTTAATQLFKQESTSLGGLEPGKYTVAVGVLEADGTLSARSIQQDTLTNGAAPEPPLDVPDRLRERLPEPGDGIRDLPGPPKGLSDELFDGLGCDADAIAGTAVYGIGA